MAQTPVVVRISGKVLCLARRLEYPQHGGDVRQVGTRLSNLGFIHADRGADFISLSQ